MPSALPRRSILGLLALLWSCKSAKGIEYDGAYFVLSAQPQPLVSERLDPVMALGQSPSNHVHDIYGGDAFTADWQYTTAQSSKCNNMGPKVDHSNYWFPAMYFHAADETYTKVPPHLEIYYHFDTVDNGPRTMFPNGFKMISGNAMLRHDDSATNLATKSIRWYCHGPEKVSVGSFPEAVTSCPGSDGFSGEIWFPFCWDGSEDFDPSDPYAHVVFGDGDSPQGGKCSGNHTKALPQLFMEFHHDISAFASKPQAAVPWVLAQGDGTGYGMHADFINGWSDGEGSLKDAIALDPSDPSGVKTKCYVGESGAGSAACFELLSDDEMYNCKITPTTGDTDVLGPMPNLPGCNPIQSGPADATIQTNCAGYKAPPTETKDKIPSAEDSSDDSASPSTTPVTTTSPATSSSATPSSSSPSTSSSTTTPSDTNKGTTTTGTSPSTITLSDGSAWPYAGCYSDLTPDRSIRTLGTWGSGHTNLDCANHCLSAGFKISGTEYGSQCFCGNEMVQTKKLDDGQCDMQCLGGGEGSCGGSGALTVYAKEGTGLAEKKKKRHLARHGVRQHGLS